MAEYYIFEGVWKNWFFDDLNFMDQREKTMQVLLY
jgi:hypothetical protein